LAALALASLALGASPAFAAPPDWTDQLVVPVLDGNGQPAGFGYIVGGDAAHPSSAQHVFVATPRHVLEQVHVQLQPGAPCKVAISRVDRSDVDKNGEQQCQVFAVAEGSRDLAILKVLLSRQIAISLARVAPPPWTDECPASLFYRVRLTTGQFTTHTTCQAPNGDLHVLAGGGTQPGDSGGVVVTPFVGDEPNDVKVFGLLTGGNGSITNVLPLDRITTWFGALSITFWKGPWPGALPPPSVKAGSGASPVQPPVISPSPPSHPRLRRALLIAGTAVATGFAVVMASNTRGDAGAAVGELKNACQPSGGLYWCPPAQYTRWMAGKASNQDLRWHVLSVVLPLWGAGFTYRFW
jgi:hypothetical protein